MQPERSEPAPRSAPQPMLAYREARVGSKLFLVLLHGTQEPSIDAWRGYLQLVQRVHGEHDARIHAFVVTDGGGPDAAQRKELAALIESSGVDLMTHVFTTDLLVRGIVTAFRWIARARATAHPPGDFSTVCADCGLSASAVLKQLVALSATFGPVRTLTLVQDVQHGPPR